MESCFGYQCLSDLVPKIQCPTAQGIGMEVSYHVQWHAIYRCLDLCFHRDKGKGKDIWSSHGKSGLERKQMRDFSDNDLALVLGLG